MPANKLKKDELRSISISRRNKLAHARIHRGINYRISSWTIKAGMTYDHNKPFLLIFYILSLCLTRSWNRRRWRWGSRRAFSKQRVAKSFTNKRATAGPTRSCHRTCSCWSNPSQTLRGFDLPVRVLYEELVTVCVDCICDLYNLRTTCTWYMYLYICYIIHAISVIIVYYQWRLVSVLKIYSSIFFSFSFSFPFHFISFHHYIPIWINSWKYKALKLLNCGWLFILFK